MVNKLVATFDRPMSIKYPTQKISDKPVWICAHRACLHYAEFATVALFHQHETHKIPMHELELRTAHIIHKTEAASDAGPETQKENT
jgi:hypothetical protein